jgi:hypothetical protein
VDIPAALDDRLPDAPKSTEFSQLSLNGLGPASLTVTVGTCPPAQMRSTLLVASVSAEALAGTSRTTRANPIAQQ